MEQLQEKEDLLLGKNILASGHMTHGFGCIQALEKFLKNQKADFTYITHPLYSTKEFKSTFRRYKLGECVEEKRGPQITKPEPLRYIKDLFLTFIWGWKLGKKTDLFIGMNCLVTTIGILLRFFGRVQKVIYFTADYSGRRFQNSLLNKIYDSFDLFSARRSDMVWNVSGKIQTLRWKQNVPKNRTLVVPNTVDFDFIPHSNGSSVKRRNNLVYVGGLNEGYGLEEFVDLLPWILKTFPDIQIDIIGGGALEGLIREKASQLGCVERVHFHGYMPYDKALAFLAQSSIGFAPYAADLDSEHYLRYCDPSKVKAYMACGCTVIVRNVPELAGKIAAKGAGWVYETKEELQQALHDVLSQPEKVEAARRNALAFSREFENRAVFQKAFEETFKRWS